MSDIHGNNTLFNKALETISFSKTDKLILLGDLIDRGDDSKGVLDTFFKLKEERYDVECIRGNHEQMFLDSFDSGVSFFNWLKVGGNSTMNSFNAENLEEFPLKYVDFIKSLAYHIEIEGFVLVHAAVNMQIKNPYSDTNTLLWERNTRRYFNPDWLGDRKIIHGHTPTSKNEIEKSLENNDQIICIDNGTFVDFDDNYGHLCVLELETMNAIFCKIN